jgi:hypothetical protein
MADRLACVTLVALTACGASNNGSSSSSAHANADSADPPECRPNAAAVIAAGLGGAAAGANGGRNQALDAFDARCARAREVQRFNAEHRVRMEEIQADLERMKRQRADERTEQAATDTAIRALERCGEGDPQACIGECGRGVAVACSLHAFQLWKGERVPQDQRKAIGFFGLGCRGGEKNACDVLRRIDTDGAPSASVSPPAVSQRILVFGGKDHKTFLGCFCGTGASDSIENDGGRFGKNGINALGETLWSRMGPFRSAFDDLSVCNRFASNPPVIVREDGTFLARLTRNKMVVGAVTDEAIVKWLDSEVCGL